MKKIYNYLFLIGLMCTALFLSGCGSSSNADSEYEGKYVSVSGESMGITLTGDDISGFSLELKSGGKGTMTIYEDSESITWENDDKNLKITLSGTDIEGTIGEDTITFENMLDMGMDLTFAKEGTEAAKPENNLPEQDKNMIGVWQSTSVTDVLGDPIEGMSGDELKMEFAADHTVNITFKGEDLGSHKWSLLGDWGSLDDDLSISWDIYEDGIEVDYSTDQDYYIFYCTKQA
ncbi:hypothetical protein [Faecalicoccus pleomorphus]|uniref:hypothetical protein n=1 Tax=Faecalicoccus pleomorphus TaxID=1323 RepID=UPI00195FBF02|nr:hypothetical protein [Faecalicoccus pleomorphus]MBM6809203.1 hypothetical protein [Faecalicoccus pleomorphus]